MQYLHTLTSFASLSVWRPLAGPVKDWPLALCDAATLNYDAEIVPTDVVYEDFVAENGLMQYREAQMWFYLADQDSSEVLVFKAADSEIESGPFYTFPAEL